MLVKKQDPFTGKLNTFEINVTQDQLDAWKAGTFIQEAMPNLSPEEREFIMTGIVPDSWQKYVVDQQLSPQQNKIEKFVNDVLFNSKSSETVNDLERIMHERNRSKINSILNPKRG